MLQEVLLALTLGTILSSAALAGAVNLGKLDLPATVTLNKATSIHAGGAPNGVLINAAAADPVSLMDTTPSPLLVQFQLQLKVLFISM